MRLMRSRLHLKVPKTAAAGEVIRVMTKLNHPMESGWRQRPDGWPQETSAMRLSGTW